ncbi:MAG: TatD family hydrolase [Candidatus Zixiibacteriota bacterium]
MIDSHCHLNFIDHSGTPKELVDEATSVGVHTIVNIGTDLQSSTESLSLAKEFGSVYATVGVHPHDARKVNDTEYEKMRAMADEKKVVAIGEIGLDYYRDLSPRKIQRQVFQRFLQMAVETKLPVVIHTREAFEDTVAIVKEFAPDLRGGVFHSFPGDMTDAAEVLDLGFLIAVNGIITFKNSRMSELARVVPLEKIVLETDAPYLTPVPFRGKTNRPALVKHVYEKMAELKNMSFKEIEKTIDRTCQKLFSLVETLGE